MTLHLAFISSAFVMTVGDRRLSIGPAGRKTEWDPYANKTIVIEAINGRVAVSYAGLAYIKSVATDLWLLTAITGEALEPPGGTPHGGPGVRISGPLNLTVGRIRAAITSAIERDFVREAAADRAQSIEVLIVGWTWTRAATTGRGRPTTFAEFITHKGEPGTSCSVSTVRRCWWQDPAPSTLPWSQLSIGSALLNDQRFERLKTRMTEPGSVMTPGEVECWMADEIRLVADDPRCTTVGTELMSVLIVPNKPPVIRFLRDLTLSRPNIAFSPSYVSTAGMILPPQQMTGRLPSLVTGSEESPRVVQLECVPPLEPTGSTSSMGGQVRRRWP